MLQSINQMFDSDPDKFSPVKNICRIILSRMKKRFPSLGILRLQTFLTNIQSYIAEDWSHAKIFSSQLFTREIFFFFYPPRRCVEISRKRFPSSDIITSIENIALNVETMTFSRRDRGRKSHSGNKHFNKWSKRSFF